MRKIGPILMMMAIVACGGEREETALSTPVIDTSTTGVVRVTNAGPSAWTDTTGWKFVEEVSIAPEEGSPGELSYANGVVADRNGNVYTLERNPALIKVYGRDGGWIRNIGREGDGPGEFRNGMLGILGDTLIVQDPNNHRLTTFLTDGTVLESHQSQCCVSSSGPLTVLADGRAVILGISPETDQGGSAAYLTGTDGVATDTVVYTGKMYRAGEETNDPGVWNVTRRNGNSVSMMVLSVPNQPSDQRTWRPDGSRVLGNTVKYEMAIISLTGDTLRTISATAPPLSITIAERDSLFEDQMVGLDDSWRDAVRAIAEPSDIPLIRPLWDDVMSDSQGRIWISRHNPSGTGKILDVFSADGAFLGSVPAPLPEIMDGFWVGNRVYVRSTNDLDLPIIRVFGLETNP